MILWKKFLSLKKYIILDLERKKGKKEKGKRKKEKEKKEKKK